MSRIHKSIKMAFISVGELRANGYEVLCENVLKFTCDGSTTLNTIKTTAW